MQDMRCLELIPNGIQNEPHRDPLRWAAHIILIVLVSPALVAVLLVGGLCIVLQAVATLADRIFAANRPSLGTVVSSRKTMREPGTPA